MSLGDLMKLLLLATIALLIASPKNLLADQSEKPGDSRSLSTSSSVLDKYKSLKKEVEESKRGLKALTQEVRSFWTLLSNHHRDLVIEILALLGVMAVAIWYALKAGLSVSITKSVEKQIADNLQQKLNLVEQQHSTIRDSLKKDIEEHSNAFLARAHGSFATSAFWDPVNEGLLDEKSDEYKFSLNQAIAINDHALIRAMKLPEEFYGDYVIWALRNNLGECLAKRRCPGDCDKALEQAKVLLSAASKYEKAEYDEKWTNRRETCAWIFLRCGDENQKSSGKKMITNLCNDSNIPPEWRNRMKEKYENEFELEI